jgi:hypothetical protein
VSSLGDRVLRKEIDYENKNISSRSAKVSAKANDNFLSSSRQKELFLKNRLFLQAR